MSYIRYLSAKKSLDDRSLNQQVWQGLKAALASNNNPLRVLELGAGIGTMIERIVEWELFADGRSVSYLAIDNVPDHIDSLKQRVAELKVEELLVSAEIVDLNHFLLRSDQAASWDLIIAHAVLDLVDLPTVIPQLLKLLQPGGLCYATINFDGVSTLLPRFDAAFDQLIETRYHATMDRRLIESRAAGDSQTGRTVVDQFLAAGADLRALGSSDWVVHAVDGEYHSDEAYFLQGIIETIYMALRDDKEIDQPRFQEWVSVRSLQIETGKLIYITHQLDVLVVRPA